MGIISNPLHEVFLRLRALLGRSQIYKPVGVNHDEVRLLVYNFGGVGRPAGSVLYRTDLLAGFMAWAGVTLTCLQEGIGGWMGRLLHGTSDSIRVLASQTGHNSVSSLTWTVNGIHYLTGITSRHPLTQVRSLRFEPQKGATLAVTSGLTVASCHLSHQQAASQFQQVLEAFGHGPGIIAGDFNISPPALSELAGQAGFSEVPTPEGAMSIDRVFYRGLNHMGSISALPVTLGISDHVGLLVLFQT